MFIHHIGGIIDDTIVTNANDFIYVVVNAACFDKDMAHFKTELNKFKKEGHDVNLEIWQNRSLIALQGARNTCNAPALFSVPFSSFFVLP